MEISIILLKQVIVVLLLIILGYVLTKAKWLDDSSVSKLTNILLMVVTPCVIINAFQKDFDPALLKKLLVATVLSIAAHIIGMIASAVIFRKEETNRYRVSRFSSIYSNSGFMGLPLLSAVLGSDGVFYGSAYLVILTVLYWTQGVYNYTGDKKQFSLKKIVTNPGIVGTAIGLLFFFLNFKMPYVLSETVTHVANMNTPLAMMILGKYLTEVDLVNTLKKKSIYAVSFVRLILVPVIFVFVLKALPIDSVVAKSVLISASCPTAVAATLFANKFGQDAAYASETVSLTTIFSVVTIPLVSLLL